MKTIIRPYVASVCATVLAGIVLTGCEPSPADARKELTALGVEYSSPSLVAAAYRGDALAVDLLLKAGIKPDEFGSVLGLLVAAANGQSEIVMRLIDAGVDVNSTDWKMGATREVMRALRQTIPNLEETMEAGPSLLLAAASGHADIVEMLIAAGAKASGVTGLIALGTAAMCRRLTANFSGRDSARNFLEVAEIRLANRIARFQDRNSIAVRPG